MSTGTEGSEQRNETGCRREGEEEEEEGRHKEEGLIISFLLPPPHLPSLPVTPHSFLPSFQPVAISDFLGNLRNNTAARAEDSDTHNIPASVTLNPTHKTSSENSPHFSFACESFWEMR